MEQKVLLTTRRGESFGEPIRNTFQAVCTLLKRHPALHVIFPAHPNPNVQQAIAAYLSGNNRVHLLPPQPYAEFVKRMRDCDVVLTDSGGAQEETPNLGKPVLVLREATERPDGVISGTAKLVGTDVHPTTRETGPYRRSTFANALTWERKSIILPYGNEIAGWSSLVARWAHNPKVGGSNPPPAIPEV